MNLRLALPLLASLSMIGCASNAQSRRDVPEWDWSNQRVQNDRAALMTHSGDTSAMVFSPGVQTQGSYYAYNRDLAPEYDRRDESLSVRTADATAGWYQWPQQQRPSLDDRGYYSTSSNPNTYVYPGSDRPQYYYPPIHRYRGYIDRGPRGYGPRHHVR